MRLQLVSIFCLLLLFSHAAADDGKEPAKKQKPLTVEQAAEGVLEAFKAKDAAALKALAEKDDPDPWLVADLLCYRGEYDAAAAFAKAAPRADTEKLPAYVEAWRKRAPDENDRQLLNQMGVTRMQPEKVVEVTADLETGPQTVVRLQLRSVRGMALSSLRRLKESAATLRTCGDAALKLGWIRRAAGAYNNSGVMAYHGSDWALARAAFGQALVIADKRGNEAGQAGAMINLGNVDTRTGNYGGALSRYERGLELLDGHSVNPQWPLNARLGIADAHAGLGEYASAVTAAEKTYEEQLALNHTVGVIKSLSRLAQIRIQFGEYDDAFVTCGKYLEAAKGAGGFGLAEVRRFFGVIHSYRGDHAKALASYAQGVDLARMQRRQVDEAGATINIGILYLGLGDHASALTYLEQGLELAQRIEHRPYAANALQSIGVLHGARGDFAKALEIAKQALKEQQALGSGDGAARARMSIGYEHARLGDHAKALEEYERARARMEELGDSQEAMVLVEIAVAHRALGDEDKARRILEKAEAMADSNRSRPIRVAALVQLARLHLDANDSARALGRARQALRQTEHLFAGLGAREGATVRGQLAGTFAVGTVAAVREQETAEALKFLESGRAGALLDALGKREALRWKAESVPEELLDADRRANAAEQQARLAYDRARKRGELEEVKAARKALDEASEAVLDIAGRIQRDLLQRANLHYPRPKPIFEIEEVLESDQALVVYGLCGGEKGFDEALALVLRKDGERVVSLGKASDVRAACWALDAGDEDVSSKAALDTLRKLLVEPLKLKDDVKQVLVSPEGPLCYLPFGALIDQTVSMTPSGTTHALLVKEELLNEKRGQGEGILALGEPDYTGASKASQAIYYRGHTLTALPATRKEVETVGTRKLLGAHASEAGLRDTLSESKRWRAVHFACHGLVDSDRPMLSSLALSRTGDDDGFLTALEILRTKIPADLAVLSACETATGKIVKGEGIVGLTRAFMFAGAPRVICSLWKVDDEATQALMIKFYELWNPKDGKKGLGAAAALKKAQEYVREFKDESGTQKWKHPYYWAAWVLWGLP